MFHVLHQAVLRHPQPLNWDIKSLFMTKKLKHSRSFVKDIKHYQYIAYFLLSDKFYLKRRFWLKQSMRTQPEMVEWILQVWTCSFLFHFCLRNSLLILVFWPRTSTWDKNLVKTYRRHIFRLNIVIMYGYEWLVLKWYQSSTRFLFIWIPKCLSIPAQVEIQWVDFFCGPRLIGFNLLLLLLNSPLFPCLLKNHNSVRQRGGGNESRILSLAFSMYSSFK